MAITVDEFDTQGRRLAGCYRPELNEIQVVVSDDTEHVLTTLLHEVAHAVTPIRFRSRTRNHHGYAFRRTYAKLIEEFTRSVAVDECAEEWRRQHGWRFGHAAARWEALDVIATSRIMRLLGVSRAPSETLHTMTITYTITTEAAA